jgi:hypothetical protein
MTDEGHVFQPPARDQAGCRPAGQCCSSLIRRHRGLSTTNRVALSHRRRIVVGKSLGFIVKRFGYESAVYDSLRSETTSLRLPARHAILQPERYSGFSCSTATHDEQQDAMLDPEQRSAYWPVGRKQTTAAGGDRIPDRPWT